MTRWLLAFAIGAVIAHALHLGESREVAQAARMHSWTCATGWQLVPGGECVP